MNVRVTGFELAPAPRSVAAICKTTDDITFEDVIAYVSQFITLKIGDLIFTGTPAGVAKVSIGDHLEGFIEDKKLIDLVIK